MIIGIIGYFTIPTVAGWIIQAGGMGAYGSNMSKAGAFAGGLAGSAAGNVAGRLKQMQGAFRDAGGFATGGNPNSPINGQLLK